MRAAQTIGFVEEDEAVTSSFSDWMTKRGIDVASYANADDLLQAADSASLDCVVCDLRLAGLSSLELQARLLRRGLTVSWIGITGSNAIASAVAAMQAGALTVLRKPLDLEELHSHVLRALEITKALRTVQSVQERIDRRLDLLTPREREVLELIVRGLNLKGIGAELGVAYKTVHTFRTALFKKMEVASDIDLARLMLLSRCSRYSLQCGDEYGRAPEQALVDIAELLEPSHR